jgi:peptidoglycan/xylan/chitin deacetylase (PgdA/CDA1 family)
MLPIRMRELKSVSLRVLKTVGGFHLLLRSPWRSRRLLILGYHGVSMHDEDEWNPRLYMKPSALETRLRILRDTGCAVLPLEGAVRQLYAGTLPPRAVALTFDDGYVDFCELARPLLKKYDMPATVYLTTLQCGTNQPIFRLVVPYMLWKARGRVVDLSGLVNARDTMFDLHKEQARGRAFDALLTAMQARHLKIDEKPRFAAAIGERLGIDYQSIASARMLTIMVPEEVRRLAAEGVSFELHTHTHRTPDTSAHFDEEISRNRSAIESMTSSPARHFCYPSGHYRPEFLPWLQQKQVITATTCDPGLASNRSNPLLLPRFVDISAVTPIEFEGWVTGASTFVSRHRSPAPSPA